VSRRNGTRVGGLSGVYRRFFFAGFAAFFAARGADRFAGFAALDAAFFAGRALAAAPAGLALFAGAGLAAGFEAGFGAGPRTMGGARCTSVNRT
jgi:hypothetical protein